MWTKRLDGVLNVSLSPLQELCAAFEAKEVLYQELLNKGRQLLAVTPEGPDSNTEQDLANLKDKWEAVRGKATERKVRRSAPPETARSKREGAASRAPFGPPAANPTNGVECAKRVVAV